MKMTKTVNGTALEIKVEGNLDTNTAGEFESEAKASIENITELKLDFAGVEYVSSAGLRVLLSLQKLMNKKGTMVITNVNSEVMEIFEITGFTEFLVVE